MEGENPVEQMQALEARVAVLEEHPPMQSPGGGGLEGQARSGDTQMLAYSGEFPRIPADTVMPTGQSVALECQDPDADYPYSPYHWPDAGASLEILQGIGSSTASWTWRMSHCR
jgi:hypothetical protein